MAGSRARQRAARRARREAAVAAGAAVADPAAQLRRQRRMMLAWQFFREESAGSGLRSLRLTRDLSQFRTAEGWAAVWAREERRIFRPTARAAARARRRGESAAPPCRLLRLAPLEVWDLILSFGRGCRERLKVRDGNWTCLRPAVPRLGVSREFDLILRHTRRRISGTARGGSDLAALEIAVALSRAHGLAVEVVMDGANLFDVCAVLREAPNGRRVTRLRVTSRLVSAARIVCSGVSDPAPLEIFSASKVCVDASVAASLDARSWTLDDIYDKISLPHRAVSVKFGRGRIRSTTIVGPPPGTSYETVIFQTVEQIFQATPALLEAALSVRIVDAVNLRERRGVFGVAAREHVGGHWCAVGFWEFDACREKLPRRHVRVWFDAVYAPTPDLLREFLSAAESGVVGADILFVDDAATRHDGEPFNLPPGRAGARTCIVGGWKHWWNCDTGIRICREFCREGRLSHPQLAAMFRAAPGDELPPVFRASKN